MPEVSGGAAYLVNPLKPEEIVEGIFKIQKDDKLRADLIQKGIRRASEFTWRKMAEEVLEIYKEIGQ
jgi:glycosyltransferase involved in cell wall biosynthesis